MSATVHFYLRTERPMPDGSAQIYLLFTINRNLKCKTSLKKTVPLKKEYSKLKPDEILRLSNEVRQNLYCWDKEQQRATKEAPNWDKLNKYLDSEKKKVNDIILKQELINQPVTLEYFRKEYLKDEGNASFAEYFMRIMDNKENTWSEETLRSYKSIITKIQKFRPSLTLNDVNYKFLTTFEDYMYKPALDGGCGNTSRTVANNMKVLKTLLLLAIKNKDFNREHNPFVDYKIREKDKKLTTRDFLRPEEVQSLQDLHDSYIAPKKPIHKLSPEEWLERKENKLVTPGEYSTLKMFLFGCYTGIRLRDVCELKTSDIKANKGLNNLGFNTKYYLELDMHKTDDTVFVPVIDKAAELIDFKATGLAFHVITGQKINEHLESIAELAGIEKKLTFHVSRHTFASTARMHGLPVEILQKLLGHKNRKYTEIYTHIPHDMIMQEMEKFSTGINKKTKIDDKEAKVYELMPMLHNLSSEKLEQLKGFLKLLG